MGEAMFLPKRKAAKIHRAALKVLEQTGIVLDHDEAADLCLAAGARRDDAGRILLPAAMVEKALQTAAPQVRMCDREGNEAMLLECGRTFFGTGSDALYNIDRATGRLRLSTLQDVADNVRIADALEGLDFVMSMALPKDVAPETLYPTVFAEMVRNTTKPLVTTLTTLEDLRRIHRIGCAVAGGAEALAERPFFLVYLEPISPLRVERSIAERLLFCAEKNIPLLFAAGANLGAAAPVTPEGGLVQGTAESLAGLVLATLRNPRVRFVYGSNNAAADMRSGRICYGSPEWFRTVAMYADMGRFYGLPSWGTAGSSDAHAVDAQTAWEAYEGILMAVQSGSTLVHDVGYLAYGSLYDARMLVLADEMIRRARHLMQPADLSDASLATDVIDDVSRNKSIYLAHEHTRRHFRESLWIPPAWINRDAIALDQAERPPLADLLADEARNILSTHKVPPLAADKQAAIDRIIGR